MQTNLATYLLMLCDAKMRYLDGIYVVDYRVYIGRFPYCVIVYLFLLVSCWLKIDVASFFSEIKILAVFLEHNSNTLCDTMSCFYILWRWIKFYIIHIHQFMVLYIAACVCVFVSFKKFNILEMTQDDNGKNRKILSSSKYGYRVKSISCIRPEFSHRKQFLRYALCK